eukprot:TRINITY_DN860_c0_g1_i1.p1 TRINITY_DN860_c0_g1~~TRINITY_DN860_c0_g1_i1.p1  ORF type:complete len:113 (-),score=60.04 TRINITY_DN860_c0_g1_i1:35-373(-)
MEERMKGVREWKGRRKVDLEKISGGMEDMSRVVKRFLIHVGDNNNNKNNRKRKRREMEDGDGNGGEEGEVERRRRRVEESGVEEGSVMVNKMGKSGLFAPLDQLNDFDLWKF